MSARENIPAELDQLTKARLMLAGQIAGGVASVPANWSVRSPEAAIARAAWDISGKLVSLAYSGGF